MYLHRQAMAIYVCALTSHCTHSHSQCRREDQWQLLCYAVRSGREKSSSQSLSPSDWPIADHPIGLISAFMISREHSLHGFDLPVYCFGLVGPCFRRLIIYEPVSGAAVVAWKLDSLVLTDSITLPHQAELPTVSVCLLATLIIEMHSIISC